MPATNTSRETTQGKHKKRFTQNIVYMNYNSSKRVQIYKSTPYVHSYISLIHLQHNIEDEANISPNVRVISCPRDTSF